MANLADHMMLDGVDLECVADASGTPLFVTSERALRSNCTRISRAFSGYYPRTRVFYSYKTNYLPYVCQVAHSEGLGAEVTSGFELFLAERNQVPPEEIIFNGIGKEREAIRKALQLGVRVLTIESLDELRFVAESAQALDVRARVGIRFNPGLARHKDWAYKFGLKEPDALEAAKLISANARLSLHEVHLHIGSQIETPALYLQALDALDHFARQIAGEHDIQLVNIGGGFPNPALYEYSTFPPDQEAQPETNVIDEFARLIGKRFLDLVSEWGKGRQVTLGLEPGRYIVSSAMLFLTRVQWTKRLGESRWVICDGGMNLVPKVREEYHDILVVNKMSQSPRETYSIGGPLCSGFDVIAYNRRLPELAQGDLIAVMDMGAYSIARAIQFQFPRCPVVAIQNDGTVCRVWRGEEFADMIRLDARDAVTIA